MNESVFYNENERFAADWLEGLAAGGQIPRGKVDRRSIADLGDEDLSQYTQAHFFAGIGGWPLALRLAGWPEDEPCWTGSCPCQPFSQAGRRRGVEDERHLWPVWKPLIAKFRPSTIFGEQVASKDGRVWLNGIRLDLEALGYAFGAADLCSAGVGAPNIRQRLYWVAHAKSGESGRIPKRRLYTMPRSNRPDGRMGNISCWEQRRERKSRQINGRTGTVRGSGSWSDFEIIQFSDGKTRRIKSGLAPLVTRLPGDVGLLRGYGNAICPPLAAEFVKASMEALAASDDAG